MRIVPSDFRHARRQIGYAAACKAVLGRFDPDPGVSKEDKPARERGPPGKRYGPPGLRFEFSVFRHCRIQLMARNIVVILVLVALVWMLFHAVYWAGAVLAVLLLAFLLGALT